MRLLHTADLHIGKIVNDFSMLEDQRFILEQIKNLAMERKVDGILLAGDIYDRAIPAGEAVLLLDEFLTTLSKAGIRVYMISGNHDSAERISFGESMFAGQGIGIGGVYKGELPVFFYEEDWGTVEIVLLPYLKPAQVDAANSGEAVKKVLQAYWEKETVRGKEKDDRKGVVRRILVTHYFVTDAGKEPELSDSETTVHVGGLDQVEASLFAGFDYVALGHIHKPQKIGEKPVYYAGSPMKYSFGEVKQLKSVLYLEMEKEGLTKVESCPLRPLREMRKVKGSLAEILKQGAEDIANEDYIQAVLTDKEELIDPIGTLRSVYPNIMQIMKEETKREETFSVGSILVRKKEPALLFEEFFKLVREEEMSEEEKQMMDDVIRQVGV